MKILSIETSCDETAIALLSCEGSYDAPTINVTNQALYSQVKEHAPFGGVFPALAKREHAKNLVPLLLEVLTTAKETGINKSTPTLEQRERIQEILSQEGGLFELFEKHVFTLGRPSLDAIAVTNGPGLEPALWVGISFAKALSYLWDIPIIPVNHMEGHVLSVLVNRERHPHFASRGTHLITYPAIALLVSGGHTELVHVKEPLVYETIGETRDDAVGEAFDKVARLLSLPYPGGPEISKLAQASRADGEIVPPNLVFPRPMIASDSFDFSYAGLKTAVLYKIRELGELTEETKRLIARSFEDAAIDVLITKTRRALDEFDTKTLIVGGGVIANTYLRERLEALHEDFPHITLLLPTRELSTDNAIMIGIAGYARYMKNKDAYTAFDTQDIRANGTLSL
ncbi:MAG: tRNA (adenosine(37)-N6)-threonylcarbamoyltransferase complex transferase subunit TsaD [Candidatus Pacebacteria bacterium]|nr:tRNA (adenosine(37)-N6)-threonylcarbamoyltransferase complex transferase subunit TsaD [Candidatus Paceibacterota bacterium]